MEYKLIGYAALGLFALFFLLRLVGYLAFSKLVASEFEHIIASDEHKTKGRFD